MRLRSSCCRQEPVNSGQQYNNITYIYTSPSTCAPALACVSAVKSDMKLMEAALATIVKNMPPRLAGSRMLRLLSASKKTKHHTYMALAGPLGAFVVASTRKLARDQRDTYIALLLAAGALWSKTVRRYVGLGRRCMYMYSNSVCAHLL